MIHIPVCTTDKTKQIMATSLGCDKGTSKHMQHTACTNRVCAIAPMGTALDSNLMSSSTGRQNRQSSAKHCPYLPTFTGLFCWRRHKLWSLCQGLLNLISKVNCLIKAEDVIMSVSFDNKCGRSFPVMRSNDLIKSGPYL